MKKRSQRGHKEKRCGSSAWLECRPVTPEVAGSSPVRTANKSLKLSNFGDFSYMPVWQNKGRLGFPVIRFLYCFNYKLFRGSP